MNDPRGSISRRGFLSLGSGLLGAATVMACGGGKAPSGDNPAQSSTGKDTGSATRPEYCGFRMGVQSWCFREWDLARTIVGMKELNLGHIEIAPSVHLPVDSSDETIKATRARLEEAGIVIDAFGVERIPEDEAQARSVFEFGKKLGVIAISVFPEYEALPLVDRLANEYDIPVGIHNHGPEDKLYATPGMFRERIADLSNMVGLCVDSGHFGRSGVNPVEVLDEFSDRVRMVHIKDMVPDSSTRYGWSDRVVGKGMLDLPGFLGKLVEIGFDGPFSLEYESEPSAPIEPLRQCLDEIGKFCSAQG